MLTVLPSVFVDTLAGDSQMKTKANEVSHDWIIGVFDDLIAYAEKQGLCVLGSQIRMMKENSKQEIEMKWKSLPPAVNSTLTGGILAQSSHSKQ